MGVRVLVLTAFAACSAPQIDPGNTYVGGRGGSSNGTTSTPTITISAVEVKVDGTTAVIRYATNVACDTRVAYGNGLVFESSDEVLDHVAVLPELMPGLYTFRIHALDARFGGEFNVAAELGVPLITHLTASVEGKDVTVTWTTDRPATSRVEAGFESFDQVSEEDGTLVTEHTLTITLSTPGLYKFRVVSIASYGAMAQQQGGTFEIVPAAAAPLGTAQNPIVIPVSTLPKSYVDNTRSTVNAPSDVFDKYLPATQEEKGAEYVYRFTITTKAVFTATVTDGTHVDIDVHLLGALTADPTQTLLGSLVTNRANTTISPRTLDAGTYYVIADTFGPGTGNAGAYTLSVQLSATSSGGGTGGTGGTGGGTTSCTASDKPTPNGVPSEESYDGSCPSGMIRIDGFCIDKFEAMLVGIDASGATFPWSPFANPGTQKIKALSVAGAVPQGYISKLQARTACINAGKRLCSNTEWTRACKGTANTTYPYGAARQPGVCNDARSPHPAIQYFGASDPNVWSKLGHPCINQLPDSLARAGSKEGCTTTESALDMMGNLHEWIEDRSPRGTGMFRGGYYVDTVINGNGCDYTTTAHGETHWDYSTGFRCCAD